MTSPPGTAGIAEPLPGYQAGGRTAPTSKREAFRILRADLGVTGAQAHALYVAYRRDQERPAATAGETYAASFIDWLMRQSPATKPRATRKYQIGETGWRTR